MYYVNIEKTRGRAVIHEEHCPWTGQRKKLERNGEWNQFDTLEEALAYAHDSGYNVVLCYFCSQANAAA